MLFRLPGPLNSGQKFPASWTDEPAAAIHRPCAALTVAFTRPNNEVITYLQRSVPNWLTAR